MKNQFRSWPSHPSNSLNISHISNSLNLSHLSNHTSPFALCPKLVKPSAACSTSDSDPLISLLDAKANLTEYGTMISQSSRDSLK